MTTRRLREAAPGLLAFLWPAIYLAPFLVPNGLQTRNDFSWLYWKYKVFLLDALAFEHRIPGWSPSEGCGYPFLANPFAAVFYLLNLFLSLFFRLAGGYSVMDHQVFTILGLCIFSAGLYAWLRESGAGTRAALVATLVMGTSLKMTELQRFPNAMHAAAWFPWLLLGIAWCRRSSTRARGTATVVASTILLATAGYPYFLYYAQFLVVPYAAVVAWPRTRPIFVRSAQEPPPRPRDGFVSALAILGGLAAGLIACWPYLSAVRRLMSLTTDRSRADLEFATHHSRGVLDTLGSLVYPPAASAEGWFYFGQLPLLFLILFVAGAFDPGRKRPGDRPLAIALCLFVVAVASASWGASSPTFRLMWEVWPGFRRLRVWPRIHVILVPALALLLARAWDSFEARGDGREGDPRGHRRLWRAFAAAVAAVLVIQGAFLLSGYTDVYWQTLVGPSGNARAWAYPAAGFAISAVCASLLLALGLRHADRPAPRRGLLAVAFALIAACDTGTIGLSQWAGSRAPSDLVRIRPRVAAAPRESLAEPRMFVSDTIQLSATYNAGVIPNWYFASYVDFLKTSAGIAPDEKLQLARARAVPGMAALLGLEGGRRIYFAPDLTFETPSTFVEEAKRFEQEAGARMTLQEYTGDRLGVDVTSKLPGVLCFIDNSAPGWSATVGGRPARVEALFGTFKAVRVGAGSSRVELVYTPW